MNLRKPVFAAILLAAGAAAHADAGGTLYHNGVETKLVSGYAYATHDPFDKSKPAVMVVLSDTPIDGASFDAASDRGDAIDKYVLFKSGSSANSVTLQFGSDAQAPLQQIGLAILAGEGLHMSGAMSRDMYVLELKHNDGKRIEGTFRSKDEARKTSKHDEYYDVHFALDVASGPPFGPALPPDGGAPYKAYEDYQKALFHAAWRLDDDSLQELVNTLTQARIDAINKVHGDAREKFIKHMRNDLMSHSYASGHVTGNTATLELSGKDQQEKPVALTVTLKKEKDDWYFDAEQVHAANAAK